MRTQWLSFSFAFGLVAGCNWLAGIDERETAQANAGEGGAIASGGHSGGAGGHNSQGGALHAGGVSGLDSSGSGGAEAGESGAAGDDGNAHGGASTNGGAAASGGTRASAGGGGGSASGGAAGNAGNGGGMVGAGGSMSTGPCSGYANELDANNWYINTGHSQDGSTIQPYAASGLFQHGECACVTGKRTQDGEASLYFQHNGSGIPFSDFLEIKLASPVDLSNLAVPTVYIYTSDQKRHCLVLSDLTQGKTLELKRAAFRSDSQCQSGSPDVMADSVVEQISVAFDTYEQHSRTDINLCVLKLAVH